MTLEEYRKKYDSPTFKHVEEVERMRGGLGTYGLDINVFKAGEEFHMSTMERKSKPAIKEGNSQSDEAYMYKIQIVEKEEDKWVPKKDLINIETRWNNYSDGSKKVFLDLLSD